MSAAVPPFVASAKRRPWKAANAFSNSPWMPVLPTGQSGSPVSTRVTSRTTSSSTRGHSGGSSVTAFGPPSNASDI